MEGLSTGVETDLKAAVQDVPGSWPQIAKVRGVR